MPRDDQTMTPPPKKNPLYVKKRQIPKLCHFPSNHHQHHHHPYTKFTNVHYSATSQRQAAPAIIAHRGKSQGPDAGPDSWSARLPPSPQPPAPTPMPRFRHNPLPAKPG